MIPVYKPYLPKNALKHAHEALDSSWISSNGKYIAIVQEKLQELLNVKHVLPVNNGTSATHLVSKALKYKYPKIKNVIVPNNVYVAAINSFLFDKEFILHTVDANQDTWNMNLKSSYYVNKNNTAALIVHNIGNIINVPNLINKYKNITFVEDNCEGFLGKYENAYAGTASLASSISFFGNKNITSGEGGAFITNDSEIYEYIKCIHGQGQSNKKFIHNYLGYNYRMTNIQAAILLGQLEVLDEIIEKKNNVFEIYRNYCLNRPEISIQAQESNTSTSNWMFGIRIFKSKYEDAENFFNSNGVEIRPMFYYLKHHNYLLSNKNIKLNAYEKNADILNQECIILPSYPELTEEEQEHVLYVCDKYIKKLKSF